jgi:hypothetical protein
MLNLPPLFPRRDVEAALIAHFGLDFELPGQTVRDQSGVPSIGQLTNKRYELDRSAPEYCLELLVGQVILGLSGYKTPYTRAYSTARQELPRRRQLDFIDGEAHQIPAQQR